MGWRRNSPGMMIMKRSSHMPMFTRIVVISIHNAERRTLLNIHIGTGIKYAVKRNIRNSMEYGHWKTCSSRSTISGPSRV